MVNAGLLGLLACVQVSLLPGPALAWSDLGHRIICEIAFQELNDRGRERTTEQLASGALITQRSIK